MLLVTSLFYLNDNQLEMKKKIKSALISVYHKDGLDDIIRLLNHHGVAIYSTGGTQTYIESMNVPVNRVEDLTGYPSILEGRVKTLHPKVFGGILAIRTPQYQDELKNYQIPEIDLVIVDLYPFENSWQENVSHAEMIEKIDIGGVSLIRAAAKNYQDVVVVPSKNEYSILKDILELQDAFSNLDQRLSLSITAFQATSSYDFMISSYLAGKSMSSFTNIVYGEMKLRYGENPHQSASFYGDLNEIVEQISGKELSYNNLVDVDAALSLMNEFADDLPTFAIIKHTNACGVATKETVELAWEAALAADPVSAFGGILISNHYIDMLTAQKIDKIFYEVLISPGFEDGVTEILSKKPNRILLQSNNVSTPKKVFKSILNGVISQEIDSIKDEHLRFIVKTQATPAIQELKDLNFAVKCAKHLKSNAIVIAKNGQLLGMGCGHTSRVDACMHAIEKAKHFGFDLGGAVMASDAFFPFPDCVELVQKEGIKSIVQPGGSKNDQLSIDYCNEYGMSMLFTGIRHFKH